MKKKKRKRHDLSPCAGCNQSIDDRYLISIRGTSWHEACAVCSVCGVPLSASCYVKNGNLFCGSDYTRLHAPHCARCSQPITAGQRVSRTTPSNQLLHTACLVCQVCKRPAGRSFVLLPPSAAHSGPTLLCREDFLLVHQPGGGDGKGSKRPRTSLSQDQHTRFRETFLDNPRPTKKMRDQLALDTGLSSRVVQVWFQNQRSKEKKDSERLLVDVNGAEVPPHPTRDARFDFEMECHRSMSTHSDSSQPCLSLKSLHDE